MKKAYALTPSNEYAIGSDHGPRTDGGARSGWGSQVAPKPIICGRPSSAGRPPVGPRPVVTTHREYAYQTQIYYRIINAPIDNVKRHTKYDFYVPYCAVCMLHAVTLDGSGVQ